MQVKQAKKFKRYKPCHGQTETEFGWAWFYNLKAYLSDWKRHDMPDVSNN